MSTSEGHCCVYFVALNLNGIRLMTFPGDQEAEGWRRLLIFSGLTRMSSKTILQMLNKQ